MQWIQSVWLGVLAALLVACQPAPPSPSPTFPTPSIGEQIRDRYEHALPELSPNKRRHYATRLYRITGDPDYLPIIYQDLIGNADFLQQELSQLHNRDYRLSRARQIAHAYRDDTGKHQRRKQLLLAYDEIPFAKNLLYYLNKVDQFGLAGKPPFTRTEQGLDYLRQVDFARFILDPDVIAAYSPQLANMVYYLHDLGIRDLREPFQQAFRQVFPDQPPQPGPALDAQVYGMTHVIIAASGYYQKPIRREDFAWIFDYLERHHRELIAFTKPDIYTEMALCFLLAGEGDSPVVAAVREALEQRYDPQAEMIPSPHWGTDLNKGEHRNVLAIMLYHWPSRLHPGPDLSHYPAYRQRFVEPAQ